MNMITFGQGFSLKKYNTLHLDVKTTCFVEVNSKEHLFDILNSKEAKENKILILGDGANILFTKDFDGLVIKNSIKGTNTVEENDEEVILEVYGGEDWHNLVTYTVNNNWSGIENLAYIPGTVGSAPVQNIAAYGQEFSETFISLDAIELATGNIKTFNKEECDFKYRHSIFKKDLKDKFFILSVKLKLSKNFKGIDDSYHSRYESIADELKLTAEQPYTLKDIYNAVISIRQKKLPDVNKVGTIGSTFANPFLNKEDFKKLQKITPDIQFYPTNNMMYLPLDDVRLQNAEVVKVPAGWLLEEAGWKNVRDGNVGTHSKHALCVVSYDGATPKEVFNFTEKMRKDFKNKYGITLEYEVNVI